MRKDIDFSFEKHPLTGDLATKSGSNAIKQSIRNIVLTSYQERGFNIDFGSNLKSSLFGMLDELDIQNMRGSIQESIQNFEPQAELSNVFVTIEGHDMRVDIHYFEINVLEEKVVTVIINQ